MSELQNHQSLSYGDALFLYLERDGMPLHVASVAVFDGVIPFDDCTRFVESKLPLIPRYRQRVVSPPFNVGLPVWEYDPNFDIHHHVREVALRRGTEAELKALAGRILSVGMDRSRPLWDLTLVRGLKGNRTGMIVRVHHSLADGISGVGLMRVLLDDSPVPAPLPKKQRFQAPPPRDPASLLVDGLIESCFSAVQRILTAHSELLTIAHQAFSTPGNSAGEATAQPQNGSAGGNGALPSADELRRFLPELASPAERLPFNVVCRGPQKFTWAEIPLAEIKAAKHACGATVNDVALAVVTAAIRRYAERHGVRVKGRALRIVVPVSVRARGEMGDLGNRITFVPVNAPLDIRNPRKLTDVLHERMMLLKGTHIAELIGFAGTLLGTIPAPVQALMGPIASQLPISICNLICTNVPGPKAALYLLGHQMLSCYPYVPIGGEMGLNIALLSYNGIAYFGFTGDVHAVPDIELLPKFLQESFAELQRTLSIRTPQKKRARPKVKAAIAEAAPLEAVPIEAAPQPVTAPVIDFPVKPAPAPEVSEEKSKVMVAAIGAD